MWQIVGNIALSIAISAATFIGLSHIPKVSFGTVSLTTLNGTDNLTNFPTTYNANNTALNSGKIDVGSTSIAAITTLANLSTVGTLVSGALSTGFTKINVAQGGTGSSTLSQYQVLLGNGTGNVTTPAGWGSSGQFLQSAGPGALPTWASAGFDTTQNYTLTGNWLWIKSASSTNFAAFDSFLVGRTATTTIQGSTTGTSSLQGFLNILGTNSTSTISGFLKVNATTTLTGCVGCLSGYVRVTNSSSLDTTSGNHTTVTATCPTGKNVLGGGFSGLPDVVGQNTYHIIESGPSSNTAYTVDFQCKDTGGSSACAAGTLTVVAICAVP